MILSTGDAEESPYVAITGIATTYLLALISQISNFTLGMREEGVQREMVTMPKNLKEWDAYLQYYCRSFIGNIASLE